MSARRALAASLTLTLALIAAACNDGATVSDPTGASSPPTAPETTSPTQEPSETPEPSETESQTPVSELEDGRHFGSIVSIDVPTQTMLFDLAYFLTGDEANQAAAEHGDEVPVPNDYYIVNDNPRLRTLAIAPNVDVWVIDWSNCCELVHGEAQPFMDAFATKNPAWDALYQGSEAPYWVTVADGVVVKIEVQYLP
jgi:hypothetical protein